MGHPKIWAYGPPRMGCKLAATKACYAGGVKGVMRPMPLFTATGHDLLPAMVLCVLGAIDLLRGFLHTFRIEWAVKTFARLDLSAAREDQLTLLGVFGISNFLTGAIYLLIGFRAPALAAIVLLLIPCAYALGVAGLRAAGVRRRSALLGRYFLLVYLAVAALVGAWSLLR